MSARRSGTLRWFVSSSFRIKSTRVIGDSGGTKKARTPDPAPKQHLLESVVSNVLACQPHKGRRLWLRSASSNNLLAGGRVPELDLAIRVRKRSEQLAGDRVGFTPANILFAFFYILDSLGGARASVIDLPWPRHQFLGTACPARFQPICIKKIEATGQSSG
jgi:hypothetical protein